MEDNTKYGHRQRMRDSYLATGADGMKDEKLLELFLSLIIPRKDVRPIAYDLVKAFGSLEGVFNADVIDLMQVNGVGEKVAILISSASDIQRRIVLNRNSSVKSIISTSIAMEYVGNLLSTQSVEKIVIVALDNKSRIINQRFFTSDGVNFSDANPKELASFLIKNNASSAIIGHNHPNGICSPSASDLNFTISFRNMIELMDMCLLDHIIVGDGIMSFRDDNMYSGYLSKIGDFYYEGTND